MTLFFRCFRQGTETPKCRIGTLVAAGKKPSEANPPPKDHRPSGRPSCAAWKHATAKPAGPDAPAVASLKASKKAPSGNFALQGQWLMIAEGRYQEADRQHCRLSHARGRWWDPEPAELLELRSP